MLPERGLQEGRFVSDQSFVVSQLLSELQIQPLAAGEAITLQTTVARLNQVDSVLNAVLDPVQSISECNEGNNRYFAPIIGVTVTDPLEASDQQHFAVNLDDVNQPPTIHETDTLFAVLGDTFETNVIATDPDFGDDIQYSIIDGPAAMGFFPGTHRLVWTPSSEPVNQVYDVTVRATDLQGSFDEHTLQITLQRKPEIISTPVYVARKGEQYSYTVEAIDPDDDPITYALVEAPQNMQIDAQSGIITWLAPLSGVYHPITIRVTDGRDGVAEQRFDLGVLDPGEVNIEPSLADNTPPTDIAELTEYVYTFTSVDPDGLTPHYTLLDGPVSMKLDSISGELRWLVPITQQRDHTVSVQVYDRRGGFDQFDFTISILGVIGNHSPQITTVPPLNTPFGLFEYDVDAIDADGDALTYSLQTAPAGMTIDAQTGLVSWMSASTHIGDHPVTIRVTDAPGAYTEQSFVLTITAPPVDNNPPTITSTPVQSVVAGQPYSYQVIATDPDGDALSYRLSTAPATMQIDAITGLISWTPTTAELGPHTIDLEVDDGNGGVASQTYSLQVTNVTSTNQLPVITSEPGFQAIAGRLYQYQIIATDSDGDTLDYGLIEGPASMTLDPTTGLLQWTPDTTDSVTVRVSVSDGRGGVVQGWSISVLPADTVLSADLTITPQFVSPGEAVTIQVIPQNAIAPVAVSLSVDGAAVALDATNQATITETVIGPHSVEATITDANDTITVNAVFNVTDDSDIDPPIAILTTPVDDQQITAPIAVIGTADDANLLRYTITLVSRDNRGFSQQIASGTNPVINDELAQLDPTQLLNGLYTLILEVTDNNGRTTSDQRIISIEGDLKVGNFSITFEDISIPVAGIPVRVTRTYDTRQNSSDLDFGYGWSVDYQNVRIQESARAGLNWQINSYGGSFGQKCVESNGNRLVTITLPDGQVEEFKAKAEPHCTSFVPTIDVHLVYEAQQGTYSTLEQLDYGLLRLANGDIIDIGDPQPVNPSHYRLTTREGMVYTLDENFGISQVEDPNGNTLTYSSAGVQHSSGVALDFIRDGQGRISQIQAPDGTALNYSYNANGDLIAFTDRGGDNTQFTYNQSHGLLDIIDPRGIRVTRNEYDTDGRLIAQIDADGNRYEYTHDIEGRREIIKDRNGNTQLFTYDDYGNVLSETNALGETTLHTYDDEDNELSRTDALGNTTAWTYDARGNQLSETDALGITTATTYNTRNLPLTQTDASGTVVITNTYDNSGNIGSITNALGHTTSFLYLKGQLIRQTDALGNISQYGNDFNKGYRKSETNALGVLTTYTHDDNGNVLTETTTRTDENGLEQTLITRYQYDAENNLIQTTDPLGQVTRTEYNAIDKAIVNIDANGNRTTFEYDPRGNQIKTTYPDGSTETVNYDAENNKLSETDRAGFTTQFVYDAANRLVETILPDATPADLTDNPRTRTEYDVAGRVLANIDANGNHTTYGYDAAGRRTSVTDALGNTTTYSFDADGNQIAFTDARGNTTSYGYDAVDRRNQTTFVDGTTSLVSYDALSRKISDTDQAGITTQYAYDTLGRLVTVTDALNQITRFGYDEQGNKISQTDAQGRATQWSYNDLGRESTRNLPLGESERFTYDAVGNLLSKTDFNDETTAFSYDNNNRLIQSVYADGQVETQQYDAVGNRIQSTITLGSDSRTVNYAYDARHRLVQEQQADGTVLAYSYDNEGNRTKLTVSTGGVVSPIRYSFDALNRLSTVVSADNHVTRYTYDAVGNRSRVSYDNGHQAVYSYHALNRLTSLTHLDSNDAVIAGFDYGLNATGRRTQIVEQSGRTTNYSYDGLNRLLTESITDAVNGNYSASYTYDAVGNRIQSVVDGVTTAFSYDANDRLLQHGGTTYSYDDNGNTLTETLDGNTKRFTYNANNQLIEVDTAGSITSYQYNSDGIRTGQTTGLETTGYVVDSHRDYAQVLQENVNGTEVVSYTYGDDLISQTRDAATHHYHYDGLGSTRYLSDASGALSDSYDYEAFGQLLNEAGSTENSYRYAGEQLDSGLDQYYLRARYYNQNTGRFTQQDTYMGNSQDPITLHKYLYANVDPANIVDPSGNISLASTGVALNGLGIVVNVATYAVNIATGNVAGLATQVAEDAVAMLIPGGTLAKNAKQLSGLLIVTRGKGFQWGIAHSSTALRRNLKLIGASKNCSSCQAHHIIPGGEKFASAIASRSILNRHNIDINSFMNGVWVGKINHNGRHVEEYSQAIFNRIHSAERAGGKSAVYTELKSLQQEIQSGLWNHLL